MRQQAQESCSWKDVGIVESARQGSGPGAASDSEEPSEARGRALAHLARTIEVEVIPRLVLSRRAVATDPAAPNRDSRRPGTQEVEEFAGLVLADEIIAAAQIVEAVRMRGASVETIYLDLLAPAARHLGELWTADRANFTEVTLGLGRLQQLLREYSHSFQDGIELGERGPRALFAPMPGEQHTFGLFMVAEFFRRGGWNVTSRPAVGDRDLVGLVRDNWFAVLGISVAREDHLDSLASLIRLVRRASRNRALGIMVGGPVFVEHPDFALLVGADATAADAKQAALQANSLLTLLARHG